MRLLLVTAFVAIAEARPATPPQTQPLACPNGADTCELEMAGTLVHAKRDALAKWDNLRISTVVDRNRMLVHASINIPHRERLKLKANARYRFKISAQKPFGSGDLWVINAKPL